MNKKIVLGFFFLLLSALVVTGAFYFKNYRMLSERPADGAATENLSMDSVFHGTHVFVDYQNNEVKADKFKAAEFTAVTIIHFWASWCEPCITEIPELLEYVQQSKKMGDKSIYKFIVVSLDESQDDLSRFLKNFPQLEEEPIIRIWDSADYLSQKFSIDKLPATVFWYRNNEIKKVHGIVDWKTIQL